MEKFTNKIIQYEENIFYLKLLLNNIKKSQLLNINREIFQKKIKDDLIFIDKTAHILFNHLLKNDKLITKDEQLHSMLSLKTTYITICKTLIKDLQLKTSEFSTSINDNRSDINKINEILSTLNKEFSREDLTTNEELNILFMEDNSKDNE